MAYTGRLRPKGVSFLGFWKRRVFNRWSIWKGREICHLGCESAQRANRWILWLYKVEKTFYFCDWSLFKRQCIIYSSRKGCKVLTKESERGTICKVYERGSFFRVKWHMKGYGAGPWGGASPDKNLWITRTFQGNRKRVRVIRSLSYRELEENSRE